MALTLLDRMTLTGSQTLRQPVGHCLLHFLFYSSSSMREWCKKKSEAGRVVRAVQSRVFCSLVLLWKWENNGLKLLPNRRVHRQLWTPLSRCVYVAFMSLHSLHPQTFCGKKKIGGTRTSAGSLRSHSGPLQITIWAQVLQGGQFEAGCQGLPSHLFKEIDKKEHFHWTALDPISITLDLRCYYIVYFPTFSHIRNL